MKKIVALVLILVFLGSPFTVSAFAAVKAGTKCTIKGQTQIYQGKKFSCIKLGQKLIWNKGVVITKKPTPTTSSNSQPEKTPSKSDQIAKSAFEAFQIEAMPGQKIELSYEIGASFNEDFKNSVLQITDIASKKYSIFLNTNLPVTIYMYSEKELEAVNKNAILAGNSETTRFLNWYATDKNVRNSSIGIAGHVYKGICRSSTDCDPNVNAAGASFPSYATSASQNEGNTTSISHELFHVIQDVYMYKNLGSTFLKEEDKVRISPNIFREGSATFMQCAASFASPKLYELCLSDKREWLRKDLPEFKEITDPKKMVAYLSKIESSSANPAHYVLGAALTEWLIAQYGLPKFVNLVKAHSISSDFTTVFEVNYGITLKQLYEESAGYLLERAR
jgi:hypothetical protein